MGVHWKIWFLCLRKTNIYIGKMPKKGLGKFACLRGLDKIEGGVFEGG